MDLVEGAMVTAELRLVRLLGRGGMGSVWVADHLTLSTQVAVKFMSPAVARDAQFAARFGHEATAAARIRSPHVVQIFGYGVADGSTPYIVMEMLDGEDLGRRIKTQGPLSLEACSVVLSQMGKALGRGHELGIVHRDIKSDNVFLVDVGGEIFVKVLDFGVAKTLGDEGLGATATGAMMGTPLFMSPEQVVSSKHVDHRADLWSVGVVAYHALTGRVPFGGETLGALCIAIHQGAFPPPSVHRPELSPAVDAFFARALARDPGQRFGSARELSEAFAAAIGQPAAQSAPPSQPASAAAWAPAPSLSAPPPAQAISGAVQPPTLSGTANTAVGAAPARGGRAALFAGGALGLLGLALALGAGLTTRGATPSAPASSAAPSADALPALPVRAATAATAATTPTVAPTLPDAGAAEAVKADPLHPAEPERGKKRGGPRTKGSPPEGRDAPAPAPPHEGDKDYGF